MGALLKPFVYALNRLIDLSYAMPLGARILSKLTGDYKELNGPYRLGKYGLTLNIIGFVFLLFASITFNFPAGKFRSPFLLVTPI